MQVISRCNRCNTGALVASQYAREESVCVSCGHVEYQGFIDLRDTPPLADEAQRARGAKGAAVRWGRLPKSISAPKPTRRRRQKVTAAQMDDARRRYRMGDKIVDITRDVNVPGYIIRERMLPDDIHARQIVKGRRSVHDLTDDEKRAIIAEYKAGKPQIEIARKYGIHKTSVWSMTGYYRKLLGGE